MMDIRHFALPDPPVMPDFMDPGTAPPSFILAPYQIRPPYDLTASDIPEPFPSCTADYALVCSVQHAIRLVTRTRLEVCTELAAGGGRRQTALENISAGYFSIEDTTGFGVFAVDSDGYFIADALRPDLVGERFNGYKNTGLLADSTVLEYMDWLVRWGGGFLPHHTTRLSASPVDVLAGDAPERATAYIEACDSGDRLGVAFKRTALPRVLDCGSKTNVFCAEQNVRRVVGLSLVDILNTFSHPQMMEVHYDISYGEAYRVGTYYSLIYQLGWLGYPGVDKYVNPSPLVDTYGTCLAHGARLKDYGGRNVTETYSGGREVGYELQWAAFNTAWTGSGFHDYPWYTAALGWHYKIAFTVGYVWNATAHRLGSGLAHIPQTAASGPLCAECTDESLPCAILNTYRLAAHASAEFRKIRGDWGPISNNTWFGSMWEDAEDGDGEYAGTWPTGTYVFAFDWDGICVADGKTKSNIGKAVDEILGSWETHERFKQAANVGGWLQYVLPDGTTRIARVVKQAKEGKFYYLASGYRRQQADLPEECSSHYAEPCGETEAQALLGELGSEMLACEDTQTLQMAIDNATEHLGRFDNDTFGDFSAYVFDEDWNCASTVACPDLPETWKAVLSQIGMTVDGGWTSLGAVSDKQASKVFSFPIEWSSPVSTESAHFHLAVFVTDAPGPPKCVDGTECPDDATCTSGRCACDYGFLSNFTQNSSLCGEIPAASLECVDVRNKLCVGLVCESCPAGSYCPLGSELQCTPGFVCPEGSSPQACPKGTIANATGKLLDSLDDCEECPTGSYNDADGQTACLSCSAGTAQAEAGSSSCARCAVGYYEDSIGSSSCKKCPGVLTTLYSGAASLAECICPKGTYGLLGSMDCASCPDGMFCQDNSTEGAIPMVGETSLWPHPEALAGYMVLESAPLAPYKCKDPSWCPGGGPGSCAPGRDQHLIGCSKCEEGKFTTQGGQCETCDGSSVILLVVAVWIGVVMALGIFAHVVNRNQLNQSNAMLVVVITLGLTVSSVQTLSIFATLSVGWMEPLRSMMKALSVVSFDLKVLKAECVVGNQSVGNMVVRQLVAPASGCYVAAVVYLKKRYLMYKFAPGAVSLDVLSQITNAVGAIYQVFFVAILLSALMPLMCYKHPNHLGHSMVSDPSVLCNNEGEHLSLVMVSAVALLTVVIPYLAVIATATVRYRTRMGLASASRHLQMFRFLFFRYHPHAYYYGSLTLLRGTLVCLVPVVFRDVPALQLLLMAMVLLVFCAVQLHVKPWRGSLPNFVDASSNMLMVMLIVAVAMTTDFEDSDDMLGICSAMIFVGLFIGICVVVSLNFCKYLRPLPFFSHFVCHHKAQAAAQARYIQILVIQHSRSSCFLDSDHLINLEELFDVVRSRCGQLIVYLTSGTLRRPWCAGEISIAYQTHQRVATIVHPSFCVPALEQIEVQNIAAYLAASDFKLVEYGITDDVISRAYRWLLCDNQLKFDLPTSLIGRPRFEAAVTWLMRSSLSKSTSVSSASSTNATTAVAAHKSKSRLHPRTVLVSSRPGDDEAVATAAILVGKIQDSVLEKAPAGIVMLADLEPQDELEVMEAVQSAHALIVLLTEGSLESTEQLQHVVDASSQKVLCIPVNTPTFRFPDKDFFEAELPMRFGSQASAVEEKIRELMKAIAVPFTTHGSLQVLQVQTVEVLQRIPRQAPSAGNGPLKIAQGRQLDLTLAQESTSISRLTTRSHGSATEISSVFSTVMAPYDDKMYLEINC